MATDGPGLSGPFSGAVLCGGASTRMGRDKATLEVEGVAMAARVADVLRRAGAREVVAIGGDAGGLARLGLTVVPDDEPGDGPLPATLTALRAAAADVVMVLSCDLVAPNPAAVTRVVAQLQGEGPEVLAAVPVVDGHHQWTHAAWRRTALASLESAHRSGARSLQRASDALVLTRVEGLSTADVADADHPRDLPGAR